MLALVLLSTVLVSCQAGGYIKEEILTGIDKWNTAAACWGKENVIQWELALIKATEQCIKFGSVGGLLRGRRQATEGLLEFDKEVETEKFLNNLADFKEGLGSKIGNLTCVLTKLEMLDSAFQVNLQTYTSGFWEKMDLSKTLAGEDPAWKQRMTQGYTDCFQLAQTWPQETLDRNPLTKVWGRHAIFFKCTKKVERHMCAAAQMGAWLEVMYGKDDGSIDWTQYGFPSDKYDQAILSVNVLLDSQSSEEKFIDEFFYA